MLEDEEKQVDEEQEQKQADEKQVEYDKAQQQIDQERANARRARETAENATRQVTELSDTVKALSAELEQTKQQIAESKKQQLDPEEAGLTDIAKHSQALEQELSRLRDQQTALLKKQQALEEKEQKASREKEVQSVQEQILKDCDEEFGEQFRNEALKLADAKVEKGDEALPRTPYEGAKLMRKCYREIMKAKEEKKSKDTTPLDNGEGGVGTPASTLKPGSRDEVLEQMRKNPKSWKARAG